MRRPQAAPAQDAAGEVGEALEAAAVHSDGPTLERAAAVGAKFDALPVGRPLRREVVRGVLGEHAAPGAVDAPATWPSTPEEQAYSDKLDNWLKQCLEKCGPDEQCRENACLNTYAHSYLCAAGNTLACAERDRDAAEIARYDQKRRSTSNQTNLAPEPAQSAAPAAPGIPVQCLQDIAKRVIERCHKDGCDDSQLYRTIAVTQKMMCEYTALK